MARGVGRGINGEGFAEGVAGLGGFGVAGVHVGVYPGRYQTSAWLE